MSKRIFLFIVLMRALAAIVITNAHYTGVYPTDLIANGGGYLVMYCSLLFQVSVLQIRMVSLANGI